MLYKKRVQQEKNIIHNAYFPRRFLASLKHFLENNKAYIWLRRPFYPQMGGFWPENRIILPVFLAMLVYVDFSPHHWIRAILQAT